MRQKVLKVFNLYIELVIFGTRASVKREAQLNLRYYIYCRPMILCQNAGHLESFLQVLEKVTQEFGLTMSVKKTCTMSLKQFEEMYMSQKRIQTTKEVLGSFSKAQADSLVSKMCVY